MVKQIKQLGQFFAKIIGISTGGNLTDKTERAHFLNGNSN